METTTQNDRPEGLRYADEIRSLVAAGTSGLISGRPDPEWRWGSEQHFQPSPVGLGETAWDWARAFDAGDHVRLLVEDAEAPAVRLILFTGSGVIQAEATFSGVDPLVVAVALEGMLTNPTWAEYEEPEREAADAGVLRERVAAGFAVALEGGSPPDVTAELDALEALGFNRYDVLADALRDASQIVGPAIDGGRS